MKEKINHSTIHKLSLAGVLITLGIVYGDIGTSPLYVMKAITSTVHGDKTLMIYGALSCIFWTLTLQTTIKYIFITLRADNRGEGGVFALYALLKKKSTIIAILTMIGCSTLLADGIITPAISVTSSVEGLKILNPEIKVIPIVILILTGLFVIQQFGTKFIGQSFGPIMVIWFTMLGILGFSQIITFPEIIKALNPVYAADFLRSFPNAYLILGAVFLCTTGAEALYSDLGHCGIKNIRVSWIFVKFALLLNYFGQGAWYIQHSSVANDVNPFYAIMPQWFLIPGIIIATIAAVIASQALITGSFTLISEAVSLNFWPKIQILQPTRIKGQVYIPSINWFLWFACCFVVIFFEESSNMEAAYGLSITITMIMTTILLSRFLLQIRIPKAVVLIVFLLFLTIEGMFFYANCFKFSNGGWFTIVAGFIFFIIMYGWYFGRRIKNKHMKFENLYNYTDLLKEISADNSIPKFATNLVYIIKANRIEQIESKIIYSIINKRPKRADTYWFLHVDTVNSPDTFEYTVHHIVPGTLIKIDFKLGFKVEPKINLYFREVLEDLQKSGEISLTSKYNSLAKQNIMGDFLFINLDRIMTRDYEMTPWETFTMNLHGLAKFISITDVKALGLDTSNVIEEKVPITIEQPRTNRIERNYSDGFLH